MEEAEISAMIDRLIEREGGFVDHKDDRGGAETCAEPFFYVNETVG
jgi:lysozyme family protein